MKITNRQIAVAARRIWGRYPDEAADGRGTIRAVLKVLRIPHETPKRRKR